MKRLTSGNVGGYLERLSRISTEDRPTFGSLTPAGLMAHLRRTFEISLGEHETPLIPAPMPRAWLRWMVLAPIPWPRGKIKAPADFTPDPEGLDAERARLEEAAQRFVAFAEANPGERRPSPLAGPMTMRQWQRLHYRHLKHHLSQYGV